MSENSMDILTAKYTLNEKQAQAVDAALTHQVSIITGGPGVGKTYTARVILELLSEAGHRVGLCAPTGRAAKRMHELTGAPAKTIHRLLEPKLIFQTGKFVFTRDRANPLEETTIILDEASMVDVSLMASLCRALSKNSKLVIIGDIDQLPPVGPGSMLKDLIFCHKLPVTTLNEIVRQKEGSHIVSNAHRVNRGLIPIQPDGMPATSATFKRAMSEIEKMGIEYGSKLPNGKDMDFHIIADLREDEMVDHICELAQAHPDAQILVPMHKVMVGTANLNKRLQNKLNPLKGGMHPYTHHKVEFREGDKVMYTMNDYSKGIFNGDHGFIQRIEFTKPDASEDGSTSEPKQVNVLVAFNTVDDDGEADVTEVGLRKEDLINLTHAWAITIHKSQGCEWDKVIIALHKSHYRMLQRNLLYTAITRARLVCWLFGGDRIVMTAARAFDTSKRKTMLKELMMREIFAPDGFGR